jgi:hypothetical protein
MHANKHEFGRAITPASATDGAQRTARRTKPRRNAVVAVLVSSTETSAQAFDTNASTVTPPLRICAVDGQILPLRRIGLAF